MSDLTGSLKSPRLLLFAARACKSVLEDAAALLWLVLVADDAGFRLVKAEETDAALLPV